MDTFYTEGPIVFQAPEKTRNNDGSFSIAMGFPVCEINEFVFHRNQVAILIAKLLSSTKVKEWE